VFTWIQAGHFPPDHGCALAAPADSFAGAEPSMPRSQLGEKRNVHLHVSIAAPEWRRWQATAIRPQIADMVRIRSSSILIKGSTKGLQY
jgi:hypothetical protein